YYPIEMGSNLRTLTCLRMDLLRKTSHFDKSNRVSFGDSNTTFSKPCCMCTMEISLVLRSRRRKVGGRFGSFCASTVCWPERDAVEHHSCDVTVSLCPKVRMAI